MTYFIALGEKGSNIRWWLFALLIGLSPFHAFLITWLKSTDIPFLPLFLASSWREITTVLIILIIFIEWVAKLAKKEKKPHFDVLDWLIIAYAGLALVFLLFQALAHSGGAIQWLFGARYDILPFLFLLFVRHSDWKKIDVLFKIFFISALVVVVFGLIHALVLPQNFLTRFGYSMYQGQYRPDIAISSCQYLEHTDRVCRAVSTFGGPTRYGTYLILALGMLFGCGNKLKNRRQFAASAGFFILILLNIVLTFSRSIWIGSAAAFIFAFFLFIPRRLKLKIAIGLLSLSFAAAIAGFAYDSSFFKTIFIRGSSTGEHMELIKQGVGAALNNPFGIGFGKVGPASVHFDKFLTENWYLQIAVESGIIGLALFLAILASISKKLLSDKTNLLKTGLFLSLLAISIAGLFTHSFEETTAVLLLAGFIGLKRT